MKRNFEVTGGIYLSQPPYELDLHNHFDFHAVDYSVVDRTLSLHWRRSLAAWIPLGAPDSLRVEFREVSEFRFLPRDPEMPFTEDDCLQTFGYWTDEEWGEGVLIVDPHQTPEAGWLAGISLMSGAVTLMRADSAHASVRTRINGRCDE